MEYFKDDSTRFQQNNEYLINPNPKNELLKSRKIRIGILASGNGSNFESLVKASISSSISADISVLIVNNPKAKVIDRAIRLNIPYRIINHNEFNSREEHESLIIETFNQFNIDLVVMAGWMRIVTDILINTYNNRLLNIHPSLLPSFKGIRSIERAFNSKIKITGCTVHMVRQEIDSGPILIQAAVPILEKDTLEVLTKRIHFYEHIILVKGVQIAIDKFL